MFPVAADRPPLQHLSRRPFIVTSRDNRALRKRLAADSLPILIEGIHCCSILEDRALCQNRTVIVRAHNIETDYYSMLAAAERKPLRKAYLSLEASKLRRYENILTSADAVLAVSQADAGKLSAIGCRNVHVVPCGHPYTSVTSPLGGGDYALYHGNLSVPENESAATYLIENVFSSSPHSLIVAGREPSQRLRSLADRHPNVTLVPSPDDLTMSRLIADAQINILVTAQPTGLKLKLLYSLFAGRHCIVNSNMLSGTPLAPLCTVADTPEAIRQAVHQLMDTPFDNTHLQRRQQLLQPYITANAISPLLHILSAI